MAKMDTAISSSSNVKAGGQGCIKLVDFALSSIGWRRGLGRGGAFLLVSPLLGPLPTRSSRGEDGGVDAALSGDPRPIIRASFFAAGFYSSRLELVPPGLLKNYV